MQFFIVCKILSFFFYSYPNGSMDLRRSVDGLVTFVHQVVNNPSELADKEDGPLLEKLLMHIEKKREIAIWYGSAALIGTLVAWLRKDMPYTPPYLARKKCCSGLNNRSIEYRCA
jgi:hypothetical protein